jgi:hypothetical protein
MSKNNHDPVAQAEAKLRSAEQVARDLEEKSQRLVARGKEIDNRVAALSFRVHAENDQVARAELDKLSAEAIAHQAETRSLEAAIKQATDKMEAARSVVAREQRRVAVREQQQLVRQFRELGHFCDRATENLRKGLIALKASAHVIGRDFRHVQMLHRVLSVAFFDTPFRDAFGVPDAGDRRTFSTFAGVINQWCDTTDAALRNELQMLDGTSDKPKEAA